MLLPRHGIIAATGTGGAPELGPTPTIAAVGTVSKGPSSATRTPAYPTGIVAGSLLLLHTESTNITADFTTDLAADGWAEAYDDQRNVGSGNEVRQWVYYKYATGSETGTLSLTWAAVGARISRILRVANAHPSAPFEGATLVEATNDPVLGPSLTPLGANRLGVALMAFGDNQATPGVIADATGGTWAGHYADTEGGTDTAMLANSVDLSSGAAISGGSFSPPIVTLADWLVRGFMIKPTGA